MEHTVGQLVIDRWATFYCFEHEGKVYRCACQVIMDTIMNDEEKLNDLRTRKDRYGFDKNVITTLVSKARKKGRMKDLIAKSLVHDGFESDMMTTHAKIIGASGTSVLMELYAVTDQGIDCVQYFDRDEFEKRFRHEQT